MKTVKITYALILTGEILWCAAIVLAPVFAASTGMLKEAGEVLYVFFGRICHQMDTRSFYINGMPFGVCARCTAIYMGFLAGTIVYPFLRGIGNSRIPHRRILAFACIPVLIDVFPWHAGLYETTIATRTISGSILGLALTFFIVPAAVKAVSELGIFDH
jgi:uncharacterized membrane protein